MRLFITVVLANIWVAYSWRKMAAYFSREKCVDSAGRIKNSDLFIAATHVIAVYKETREKIWNFWGDEDRHRNELFIDDKTTITWNLTRFDNAWNKQYNKFEFVVGILVVRMGKTRKNDNPVVFTHLNYTLNKEEPGKGDDFSEMYNGDPFRPGSIEINAYDDDDLTRRTHTFLTYTPPKDCYATGSWIANEGFYLLDTKNQEWYPIYYDMWADDVFIM